MKHLIFRRIELKSYSPACELKFILRRRFERGSGLLVRPNK
jgi:hypothetical protein